MKHISSQLQIYRVVWDVRGFGERKTELFVAVNEFQARELVHRYAADYGQARLGYALTEVTAEVLSTYSESRDGIRDVLNILNGPHIGRLRRLVEMRGSSGKTSRIELDPKFMRKSGRFTKIQ